MANVTRELDGCEHIYTRSNGPGSSGLAVIVWRDEAAMKAAADHIAADTGQLKDVGMTVSTGQVYSIFAEL
jgi:hypothetical protein